MSEALRLPEAAQRLMCTLPTLYALHHRGEIVIRKIGSRSFVLAEEVDRILRDAPPMSAASVRRRVPGRAA